MSEANDNATPTARGNVLPYEDRVNRVAGDAPFRWLAAGWRDFSQAGMVSVGYGAFFVAAGLVLTLGLHLAGLDYLIVPFVWGFLLVGPALTVGLYAVSRDLADGRTPSLRRAMMAWRFNPVRLLAFGLCQVLFLIVWVRLAVMIFALSFPYQTMDLQAMVNAALFTTQGNVFLLVGTAVGAVMATLAFVVSVFSLPMLLDRQVGMIEAVVTSVVAVVVNRRVMALWAALIALFTFAGLVTAYVGLAVTLPLIGHASWHAYRAVIQPPAEEE